MPRREPPVKRVSTPSPPAVLGGSPVVTAQEEPPWPPVGMVESAALAEITEQERWYGFSHKPAKWRAILEQVVAATTGFRYGVGQPNGTLAIGSGLRAQVLARGAEWVEGRGEVLVADLTHASAHHGVLIGLAPQLGCVPRLVPIDAKPDATMDEAVVEEYLARHADRVLGVVPATMYGNFGAIERIAELCERHRVACHHDNALGGAARYDGRNAVTASISGQAEGKATPAGEAGLTLTSDPEVASWVRADTDTGHGAGRLDPIPYAEHPPLAAGNQRLGEHPAALMLIQWLRALHARLQMRENRRLVQELLADTALFPVPALWNPPMDAEHPPFFALYMSCTDALEEELGLSPEDLRVALWAEGVYAEPGFTPTHADPAWRHVTDGLDLSYEGSARVFERAVFIHAMWLRDARFPGWLREILERVVAHKDALRGISATVSRPAHA
jgi:dTDP-4-amino-4,6-dideoxygalactose transaminase